jgi:dTDP-4-dehydrorhamnose reductase
LNVYGHTKLAGERAIEFATRNHIILRCSWIYSSRRTNFLLSILKAAFREDTIDVVDDCIGSPTGAPLIADVTASIARQISNRNLRTKVSGIYHLSSLGAISWHEYASFLVEEGKRLQMPLRLQSSAIKPISERSHRFAARRPLNSSMSVEKLSETFSIVLPEWQWGVRRTLQEIAEILKFPGNSLAPSKPNSLQ